MKNYVRALLGLILLGFMGLAMAETAPDVLVKSTADDVLSIIKSDKDIQAGDQSKINALIEDKILPNFDFDRISRMVLGKNWRSATPEQQASFEKEFRSLLIRTYSSALSKYRNQTINVKPLHSASGDKEVTVNSEIVQPGGQPVKVDYSLESKPEGWKVYDIVIEGVSLVTNYRGQFDDAIRQSSLDGLIQKLADKNKQGGGK